MKWIIAVALILLLWACNQKQETTTVTRQDITELVYASGMVKSKDQYQVFPTANGIINKILLKEGDAVKQGQPILLIENEAAQLNTANARLAAENASLAANQDKLNELKVNIELARSKMQSDSLLLARQRNLWAQQIGTRVELEQRELAYENSATAYKAANLRYNDLLKQLRFAARQSQTNLAISSTVTGDYTVKSQTNGMLYKLLKEKGEMVNTQTPVAIIGSNDEFLLELQVDEYDIARVRLGQQVLITMDSYKDSMFTAVVAKVDPIMNERSRSFTIEATFVKQPPALYPHLTAEANIVVQTKPKALTIPRAYLVNDSIVLTADNKEKRIVTGLKDYQVVEVISGLAENDVILKPKR